MSPYSDPPSFDAEDYWNRRLDDRFSLRGVGHVQFSHAYNRWLYARKRDVLQDALRGWDGGLSGKTVLDIGSGTGFFVERYLALRGRVTGVDLSRRSIAELSGRFPGAEFHLLDIGAADGRLPGRQFDIINMWDVMYHIVSEERFLNACRNIAAMGRPGTRFLVTDLMASERYVRPAPHVVFRNRAAYQEALGPLGFVHLETRPLYRFLNRHYRWPRVLTDVLAPLWYGMDSLNRSIAPNNICLSLWERQA
jgi:2-polyprenyl-3-methyl-5-hydroxy-6-metoxy-1,4-benzoquinol methylase